MAERTKPTPLPCPFCGGPAEIWQRNDSPWYVECGSPGCIGADVVCYSDNEAGAIAWWNQRTQPDVNADLLTALRWYGERASSLASTKDGTYAEAVIVELALDAGGRADAVAAARGDRA